ncbi:MAG: isochorismatase family protein [Bacillota bacterium]
MKSLIVVDCQYDFIDGSLACENAEKAVKHIIDYINSNDVQVHYSMDWHTMDNKSFKINGGIWPVHCVQNERGAQLHKDFEELIKDSSKRPSSENVFYKGMDDENEEYSAFGARSESGTPLKESLQKRVLVAGFASEYCVRETVLALIEEGFEVELLEGGLGYVKYQDHIDNLKDLEKKGVEIVSGD